MNELMQKQDRESARGDAIDGLRKTMMRDQDEIADALIDIGMRDELLDAIIVWLMSSEPISQQYARLDVRNMVEKVMDRKAERIVRQDEDVTNAYRVAA